ncbi:hypothetical protein HPP92_020543 [Vanilla planifolia]|uniref:Uncharacterized protein n=1 Tax=Vanilla planifolia TaxID=51239 RepID=A0A835Q7F7_VANPL|nr:hypothetical protein HPP92_020543 [Vanilla planifolia]
MESGVMIWFLLLLGFVLSCHVYSKECTNIPTQMSSHTIRSQMTKENWEGKMLSFYYSTSIDNKTYMDILSHRLLERKATVENVDWMLIYQRFGSSVGINKEQHGENFLKEVSLHDVRLDPGSVHWQAQQTNLEYLLLLDVDRLVWSFRKQAGIETSGKPYGGWEAPNVELRGHFVGHYMSAAALMWASTHNNTLQEKMISLVDALYVCQKKIGTGYLSAFPTEFFDRFEAIKSVWAPYYTIHKIMAGLVDQYTFGGNSQALEMVVWMAEYFGNRVKNVIHKYTIERHWLSLNEETGGMNDVLYNLYSITGDQNHLILAHLFDKPCFLGLLALQTDGLSGFHANTHIPIVVGAQRRYEIVSDQLYKEISIYFMNIVNSSHLYATGGTSVSEFWSNPKRLANTLSTEDEESCTTYNMLKVARNLFKWTKEMAYADYYERALTNGVLGIQRGREPGVMIYMLPQGRGQSKARSYHGWGTKFDSFWCCYGTGIESFSKLGDSIYFEMGSPPGLYILQFIPSSFNWKSVGISLIQRIKSFSSVEPLLQISFNFSSIKRRNETSTLNFRIPFWSASSKNVGKVTLNSEDMQQVNPGSFLSITHNWGSKDNLQLQLPIKLWTEAIKDDRPEYASIHAIFFGPYLLAGLTHGDWDIDTGNSTNISDWITAVPQSHRSLLVTLFRESGNGSFVVSVKNNTLSMSEFPKAGTDAAINATFKIVPQDSDGQNFQPSWNILLGKFVRIEPFGLPGMFIIHQEANDTVIVSTVRGPNSNSLFRIVPGLDGHQHTVSLEPANMKGCFLYSDANYAERSNVKLACKQEDASFRKAVSFSIKTGVRQYHPISFKANGLKSDFILEPLMSLMDESYTPYFNLKG